MKMKPSESRIVILHQVVTFAVEGDIYDPDVTNMELRDLVEGIEGGYVSVQRTTRYLGRPQVDDLPTVCRAEHDQFWLAPSGEDDTVGTDCY